MDMTIPQLFEKSAAKFPNNTLVLEKDNSREYQKITYSQIKNKVYQFSCGLIELGIKKGERLALLSEGRSEWLISELSMLYLGAINVPLSVKINELSDLSFRIKHSECKYIVVSERQIEKVRNIINQLPLVTKVIVITDSEIKLNDNEIAYNGVLELGKNISNYIDKLNDSWKSINNNDIANISYTSGTTADPKGIMLTHRNYTANVEQAKSLISIPEYYSSLLILPWDHSFGHTVGLYTLIDNGASLSVIELGKTPMETLRNIPKNIKETKPTFILSVPALAKNFKKNIEKSIKDKGSKVEKLFNNALELAYKYNGIGWDKGKNGNFIDKLKLKLYDKILFSKIRDGFGGKLEFFIGGGALLDIELQKFFYAIGIPMFQGYGLSESAPIISSNAPLKHKLGSSGFIVKNLDLKICDSKGNELPIGEKGEIVVKGENIMKGYWNNETATNEALQGGWLFTGDMGYMDNDGFLYVLGRFKSLLIGNDGEKYSPEGIEEALVEQSNCIEQVMLYNNQNNYTSALIYPNKSYLINKLKDKNLDIKTKEGAVAALRIIQVEIDHYLPDGKYETMFPHRWIPAAFGVLDEGFTEENRLLNSTMKMVRGKVEEKYQDYIEYLNSPEGKNIINERNIKNMTS
ncbi:MAG: long-chain fatty acid--CoA ligase [Bacteroidetes bacterium]|nr:MAG: long-chain fatty acid--CoA ligase [Bacteroidota bacterium]